jgi:hypothetical protein
MGGGEVTLVQVKFGDHISRDRIVNMRVALESCGDAAEEADGRTFLVQVRREAKLAYLEKTLLGWELHGFAKWHRVPQP